MEEGAPAVDIVPPTFPTLTTAADFRTSLELLDLVHQSVRPLRRGSAERCAAPQHGHRPPPCFHLGSGKAVDVTTRAKVKSYINDDLAKELELNDDERPLTSESVILR